MAYNRKMAYRYNSYITKKIPYINLIEFSKQLLFIISRGKETN